MSDFVLPAREPEVIVIDDSDDEVKVVNNKHKRVDSTQAQAKKKRKTTKPNA
jgi:hypothetical protein